MRGLNAGGLRPTHVTVPSERHNVNRLYENEVDYGVTSRKCSLSRIVLHRYYAFPDVHLKSRRYLSLCRSFHSLHSTMRVLGQLALVAYLISGIGTRLTRSVKGPKLTHAKLPSCRIQTFQLGLFLQTTTSRLTHQFEYNVRQTRNGSDQQPKAFPPRRLHGY